MVNKLPKVLGQRPKSPDICAAGFPQGHGGARFATNKAGESSPGLGQRTKDPGAGQGQGIGDTRGWGLGWG